MTRKRRRHTPDQIIPKLAEGHKQLAAGPSLEEVCRHLEIAESTWHRWLAAMQVLRERFGVSERRSCRTQRLDPPVIEDEQRLRELQRDFARRRQSPVGWWGFGVHR